MSSPSPFKQELDPTDFKKPPLIQKPLILNRQNEEELKLLESQLSEATAKFNTSLTSENQSLQFRLTSRDNSKEASLEPSRENTFRDNTCSKLSFNKEDQYEIMKSGQTFDLSDDEEMKESLRLRE